MNQLDWEKAHYRRIQSYMKQIDAIFDEGIKEAAAIGATFNANDLFSKPFSFDDYPRTKARIDKMTAKMQSEIQTTVVNGITAEWENSNLINDQIAQRILGIKNTDDIPGKFKKYFNNNNAALQAFINRKEAGMKLSDRVWKYTNGFKKEIEAGLDIGIREGLPAGQMARDLKQYLQHPDKLFRRVRDQHGILQLSKNAKQYHPGQGVYRSSYKNAMRLTRTETNMAYRAADHERIQQLDFVVGIEVRLTNNPGHVYDICDELKGKYPKDFKFTGWHPHCMCHTVTILKTPDELQQDVEKIEEGKPTDTTSQNQVKDLPQNFKDWAEQNKDRIAAAKSQPYFIRDNFKGTDVDKWYQNPISKQPETPPALVDVPKPEVAPATESVVKHVDVNEENINKILEKKSYNPEYTKEQAITDLKYANELRAKLTPEFIEKAKLAGISEKDIQTLIKISAESTVSPYDIKWRINAIEKAINKSEIKLAKASAKPTAKKPVATKVVETTKVEKSLDEFITPDERAKLKELEGKMPKMSLTERIASDEYREKLYDLNEYKRELSVKYADKTGIKPRPSDVSEKEYIELLKNDKKIKLNKQNKSYETYKSEIEKLKQKTGITDKELGYIQKYTSNYFETINNELRGIETLTEEIANYSRVMDRALTKMPRFQGEVLRGMVNKGDIINQLKTCYTSKSTWIDKGYFSTAYAEPNRGSVQLIVKVKNGAIIDDISVYGHAEAEVLLRSNSKFKVTAFKEGIIYGQKRYYFYLEEI